MSIFDWRNKNDWIESVNSYAAELLNDSLIKQLRIDEIEGCWSDDMSWLPDPQIVGMIEKSFRIYYSHIKCFHGARPIDVSSYYKNGFLGQNRNVIEEQFRMIFSDVDKTLIEKSIGELGDRGNSEKGKIYFVCDDSGLIEECGHYLIQGSEYIMGLAATLCRYSNCGEDYRLRLRKEGIPTIFEVDVPLEIVPDNQVLSLVQVIITSWIREILFQDEQYNEEMNFVIYNDIAPSCIVGHKHPRRIKDPHFNFTWYYPKSTECEMCR